MIAGKYVGIRPAPSYPAGPNHAERYALFALLGAPEKIGVTLTESYAMLPTAAVNGFYLAQPQARYFAIGEIGEDQLADISARKAMTLDQARRWFAPVI